MRHWKISEICTHSLNDNDQRTLISSQMTSYQCNRDSLPFFRQFSGRVRYYERIQDYGHVLNSKITVPWIIQAKICLGEIFSEVQKQYTAESISHQNIVDTTSMLFQKRKLIEYSCSPKSAPQYRNRSFVTRKLLFL